MLEWFIAVNTLLQQMRKKAIDAAAHIDAGNEELAKNVQEYLRADHQRLKELWTSQGFGFSDLSDLGRHISFGQAHDYNDILNRDLSNVQKLAEQHARESDTASQETISELGFENLLHPIIADKALPLFLDGHLRDAVLTSVIAIFDLIRDRTGLGLDGPNLVTEAFSLERGTLVFSEIATESGRNDQKGFMQIIMGMYAGIRNPKAHSLTSDLDEHNAAQYLVFASLIARRITEAQLGTSSGN